MKPQKPAAPKTTYTPGPWYHEDDDLSIYANDNVVICEAPQHSTGEEFMQNASLIAAAPELLAALREALTAATVQYNGDVVAEQRRVVAVIRAAISKAAGEGA